MARIGWVPDADMAVCVYHVLFREDAVRDHKILDDGVEVDHNNDKSSGLDRHVPRLTPWAGADGSFAETGSAIKMLVANRGFGKLRGWPCPSRPPSRRRR